MTGRHAEPRRRAPIPVDHDAIARDILRPPLAIEPPKPEPVLEDWRDLDDPNDRRLTPAQASFRRRLGLVVMLLGIIMLAARCVVDWSNPNPALNGAELAGLILVGFGVLTILDVEYRNRVEDDRGE